MYLSELQRLSSTLLADVGAPAMHSRIRPMLVGARLVGPALTVQVPHGDNLAIHAALALAQPGDVLVIDGGDYRERALMGGIMMTQAKAAGVAGVVIDGAMRDWQELQSLSLPAYACGVHPNGPHKNGPGSIHTPVSCGGVLVRQGDWVVADDDGVVVVAPERAAQLIADANAKQGRENQRLAAIAQGILKPAWLDTALAANKLVIAERARS